MIKKWKKKLAEKAGFTLVELIVVVAILGILAGIAVPMYTGYIKRAHDAKVLSELSGVLTTAQAANAMTENVNEVDKINVTSAGVVTVELSSGSVASNYYSTFAELYIDATASGNTNVTITGLGDLMDETSYDGGATWEDGEWTPITTTPAPSPTT